MSRYHCYSCDLEADDGPGLLECYELGHEVLKVLDEIDHNTNQKNDEVKLAEYAELILSKTKFLTLKDTASFI